MPTADAQDMEEESFEASTRTRQQNQVYEGQVHCSHDVQQKNKEA